MIGGNQELKPQKNPSAQIGAVVSKSILGRSTDAAQQKQNARRQQATDDSQKTDSFNGRKAMARS